LLPTAEILISFGIGVLLLYMCNRPIEYLLTRSHPDKFTWTFNDANNNPITYTQSIFFLPDVGVCLMGVVLVLDGIQMIFARSKKFVMFALALTAITTLLNIAALIATFNQAGFQIWNFVAAILGGYIGMYQWTALKQLQQPRQLADS